MDKIQEVWSNRVEEDLLKDKADLHRDKSGTDVNKPYFDDSGKNSTLMGSKSFSGSKVLSDKEIEFCLGLLKFFTLDGKSMDTQVTLSQIEIFGALVLRKNKRIHIMTSTQYGKSLIVSLACLVLACIEGEIVSVVAPTEDKARIIMRYFLQHIGDHPLFYSQLEKSDKVDKLAMEVSKDRLILKNRGGIFTLSVNAGDSNKGFQAAMGEGSRIVIQDESALIPDPIEATVFRMIAGKSDAMYVKIGNPFYRNHFYKSSVDPNYLRIVVDYKRALKEGRYDYETIEEARTKPNFDVLFGCEFPSEAMMGKDGYVRLLSDNELKNSIVPQGTHSGYKVLGVDPAAGGDNSTIVMRSSQYQEILFDQQLENTMDFVGVIMDVYRAHQADFIVVDKTGIGQGVFDRLKDAGMPVRGVSFGESSEEDQFRNFKADLYWRQRKWLLSGGRLIKAYGWDEFYNIKYKNHDGKVSIQPKEELLKEGYQSPNCVDAAVLTMAIKDTTIRSNRALKSFGRSGNHGNQFHDHMQTIWRGN